MSDFIPAERAVLSRSGKPYLLRVTPYRTSDNKVEGVVLTMTLAMTLVEQGAAALSAERGSEMMVLLDSDLPQIGMVERREAARSQISIGPAPRATGPQVMGSGSVDPEGGRGSAGVDRLYVLHASRWVRAVSASSLKPLTRLWTAGAAGPKWSGNFAHLRILGAILWRAEPDTLKFTCVSPRAQALLGYWLERWTGETNFWKKHLFPDDRELVATACQRVVRERKREDFEFRMVGVHGQLLWFHAAAELIEHPGRKPELAA